MAAFLSRSPMSQGSTIYRSLQVAPARLWDQQAFLIKAPPAASAIVRLPGTTLSRTPSMTSPLAARHLFRAPSLRPRHRPIFKLTCTATASTAFPPTEGTTFYTNDPGLALITGKCADIGRRTVPQLRGLASHAPYFSNGSAATLADVVTFYNTRFNMKLTAQQQTDLVNFLNSL